MDDPQIPHAPPPPPVEARLAALEAQTDVTAHKVARLETLYAALTHRLRVEAAVRSFEMADASDEGDPVL